MPFGDDHVMFTLGVLMAAALAAGGVGRFLRLPKVTSYLLMGVLLGPSALHWIPHEHIERIEPLTKLAIALVLFNLGCHFPMVRLRRILQRSVRFSAGELVLTFLLVSSGVALLGQSWDGALLLGALALATAPATTILVLKEMQSEGPVTEYAHALVAINNLVSIILFELLFVGIHFVQGKLQVSATVELGYLARDLVGSAILGIAGGLAVSFCYMLVAENRRLVLLVAAIIMLLGACEAMEVPYLLTFLTMGVTVANTTYHSRQVDAELDRITGLLCVVFFVTHGAELDLAALGQAGLIGVAYIVLRTAGKYFGVFLAGADHHEEPMVRHWLGAALLSQAGAAIALSAIAVTRDPVLGGQLQTIILGTVVVFEIVGPLLIRFAVIHSGEVPLAQAITHASFDLTDQVRTVWNRLLLALGRDPWKDRSTGELTVNELMRKKVKAVPQEATFDDVVSVIEHSRDNTYPVVSSTGELVGLIRYRELANELFDSSLGALVRASDVMTPAGRNLYPDDTASDACAVFASGKDDCIPVTTREKPHQLLGVVRRRDILRLLIRGRVGEGAN